MKTLSTFSFFLLLPFFVWSQGQGVIKINGTTQFNGSVAYLDCSTSTIELNAGEVVYSSGNFVSAFSVFSWQIPQGWTFTNYSSPPIGNTWNGLPNGIPGQVNVVFATYFQNNDTYNVTVDIRMVPPAPTFTSTPTLCNTGQQGTYTLATYSSIPFSYSVEWQTTGGVLVNGSSSYVGSAPSALSATITHNSPGKVRVRFANTCGGVTPWVEKAVGKPIITPTVNGNPWTTTPYYVNVNANNFLSTNAEGYTQAVYWNTPSPSSVSYGPYAAPYYLGCNTIAPTGVTGFSIKADVTNGCGTSSFTFVLSKPWNGYRVAQNPATSQLTVLVESTDNDYALPDELSLLDEKGTVLRKVTLKTLKTTDSFVAEKSIRFDVSSLPRGTYYLHGTKGDATDKRRVILE